jgi:hypothetical protein
MTMKFQVVVTREREDYVATCPEVRDAVARADSVEGAVERPKALIRDKFRPDDDPDDGTARAPRPVSPPPRGPLAAREKSHEEPEV